MRYCSPLQKETSKVVGHPIFSAFIRPEALGSCLEIGDGDAKGRRPTDHRPINRPINAGTETCSQAIELDLKYKFL